MSIWEDAFASLLDNYEKGWGGLSIEEMLQKDWDLFNLDSIQIRKFLSGVFNEHDFLEPGVTIVHKIAPETPNYLDVWNHYINHVTRVNRFFPPKDLPHNALDPLGELILGNSRDVESKTQFYRGRITSNSAALESEEMGKPPFEVTTGGRANPAGIPHLYLAFEKETCAAECRVGLNGYVSIATFVSNSGFKTLDLNDVDSINPFTTEDDLGPILQARTVLNRLRDDIAIPARSHDSQLDYIATQFLCEYAKNLGLSGVIYPSTLLKNGTNLVLFDDALVDCRINVEAFQIVRDDFKIDLA
ncbi:RES family NAD+ phosphorylase [Rhodococcus cerastii]|nr:RES family NAD+ phosphorylase [Rhodococcus cerastii]